MPTYCIQYNSLQLLQGKILQFHLIYLPHVKDKYKFKSILVKHFQFRSYIKHVQATSMILCYHIVSIITSSIEHNHRYTLIIYHHHSPLIISFREISSIHIYFLSLFNSFPIFHHTHAFIILIHS